MTNPSSGEDEATISLPSLAIVAVLGYFIYRYFFASSSRSDASSSSSSSRIAGQRFTAAQVEQVAQMFPQLNRRDIMWDLHRNRGSVPATTERVLMGRGLDPAPPSFQPPASLSAPLLPSSSSSNTTPSIPVPLAAKLHPDLITRYNLQSRVNSSDKGKEKEDDPVPVGKAWTNSKDQRQQVLQRRRDEMILKARRRLQEKDALNAPTPPSTS